MSAVVINFKTRKRWRARSETNKTKNRLAAIERHRQAMGAYRESSAVAKIDPIFAAIDAHCKAAAAYHVASDVSDEASEAAMATEGEVLGVLLDSRAITMTGLLALLEHLGQPEFLIFDEGGTGETVFSGAMECIGIEAKAFPLELAAMLRNAVGMVPQKLRDR
jgi:hypothetical protein